MTELDTELGPLALDTINEFGKSVTLTPPDGSGDYDPDTASVDASPGTAKLVKAIVEDDNVRGLVEGASKKLTVAAQGLDMPGMDWSATLGGTTYAVLNVAAIYSGELACLYVLQVGHK